MASSATGRRSGVANTPARGPAPRRSGTVTSNRRPIPLPRYQALVNPLNQDGIRALRDLQRTHSLQSLKRHLSRATNFLTIAAGDVNDRYQRKLETHRKWRARIQGGDDRPEDEAKEQSLQDMKSTTDEMTSKIEESMRKIIDAKAAVEWTEPALQSIAVEFAGGNVPVPTQSTLGASQYRRTRQNGLDSESDDNEEEASQHHPLGMVKRKMREHQDRYENLSKRQKYAANNDYIGFKKIVHDARHPETDAKPLPHASTWFPDPPSVGGQNGNTETADEDDDLEVASERISIKCPITLLPMKEPISSKRCPHSFERNAIMELINASRLKIPGPNGINEKAMKCPVCEVMLSASTLHTDPVLIRKIARAQAREAAEEDSDSDVASPRQRSRNHHVDDVKLEKDARAKRGVTPISSVKLPPASPMAMRTKRDLSMIPSTQLGEEGRGAPASTGTTDVVDLEGDGDEEEEEEVEELEEFEESEDGGVVGEEDDESE